MRLFDAKTISTKLKMVILSTTLFAVVLVFIGFFIYERVTFRKITLNDIETKADIIAENINAALAFRDSTDAARVLSSMKSQRRIMSAAIYDQEGKLFAVYSRDGQQARFSERPGPDEVRYENDAIVLFKPVSVNGERIGTIHMRMDLLREKERFWSYIQIACIVLLGALGVAYFVATVLERNISLPILNLVAVAQKVSQQQDYSLRAVKTTNDETGILSDAFNDMLIQIQQRDATLQESEERYRYLFKNNPLPMWVFDSETLAFLEVNDAAINHYGYSREEFLHMTIKEIRPPEEVPRLLDDVRQHHRGHDAGSIWKHRKKDGTIIDVEITSHELLFGGREGKLVLANDITEKHRAIEALQRSEERYRTTLDSLQEGCQIIGFDYRYIYLNDVAAKQGRMPKEKLLGKTMMEVYPGIEHSPFFKDLQQCLDQRTPHHLENEFVYPDGSVGWFDLSIEPVPEGVFILSIDITKEKLQEKELKSYREHLEELVAERTKQLEASNKELESFSYSVSHDLRAPLRHVNGFVDLLLKHAADRLDEKSRRYLNTVASSAKEMGTLIDELLVFSRMARVEMHATEVDMGQIVNELLRRMEKDIEQRSIKWNIGLLPVVEGDLSLLRLVFQNLIENAVKYTRTRQQAHIEIGSSPRDNEVVVFVRDNGVGFNMEYKDKLFGVFQRLHSAVEFEGTGIGLANVRRIIQRHGGTVWAESEIDKGATFYFSIPKKKG
ncbi:MAG: PAS domain S-box protein [Bacteroidota bacterium]